MSSGNSARQRVRSFSLGRQLVTRGARAALTGDSILSCFSRHAKGDFGDVCTEDFDANIDAIANGSRVVSQYCCTNHQGQPIEVCVITEADRSKTTLLLAEEY